MPEDNAVRPWFLYMIKTATGSLYTGISTNVVRRFDEHRSQSKKTAKALRGRAPLTLVYCAALSNHTDALKAELWVKKQSRFHKQQIVALGLTVPFEHRLIPLPLSEGENITE